MLDQLRRGATTKFAAIVIFIPLIIAFALWGVGPEMRQTGGNTLAQVGKVAVTPDQFQQAYQIELNRLSQQFGRRLTPDQARAFGVDQLVLSRLVSAAALDSKANEMGLTLSEKGVADNIRSDPGFAGLDGKFSRSIFDGFLRQNGLSEAGYIAIRRKEDVREQLTEAVVAGAVVPATYVELVHRHRAETRVIEHVTVDPARIVKVADPDETQLKAYYEANKGAFMTPAYRRAALLLLTREIVKGKLSISEDDVKAAYEQTKDTFNTPETRKLQQVAFADKAAAAKAQADLAKAKNFAEAAEKLGFKASDIDLGVLRKSDLIDRRIADAAFSLKKGETSAVVEGQFTNVILHVVEVTPGTTKTYDDVKALVRDRLANERAGRELTALHDQAENERNAGRTLKEVGEKLGLTFLTIEAIDRAGNGPDGKPVAGVPDTQRVLAGIFAGAQGVEADAIDLSDGGYAWFDVLGVTSEKQRPFEDVKADAQSRWLAVEKAKALTEAVAKLVERGMKGESLEALAKEAGGKVEKTAAITRNISPPGVTADGVRQAFALPKGAVSAVSTADGSSRTLFRVEEVTAAAAPTTEEADRIRTELQRSMRTDAITAYVSGLQQRYGVTVNQAVFQQTLGLDRETR